jgi:hypothetical protein
MPIAQLPASRAQVRLGLSPNKAVFGVAGGLLLATAFQFAMFAGPSPVQTTPNIPPGTVLPIRLDGSLDINSLRPEQRFEARIAQEVPLPSKEKISLRSRVMGTVISVNKDSDSSAVSVSLKFDQLEEKKATLNITSSLRAVASFQAVRNAQMSLTGADAGSPAGWATTVQIGGDNRFGDGGKVRNTQKQAVGKGVLGGVMVHIAANPALGCDGPAAGNDRLQALWVFSSNACGVYDLRHVKIIHNGQADPVGVITLEFAKAGMKLESGTAFLLRTIQQK